RGAAHIFRRMTLLAATRVEGRVKVDERERLVGQARDDLEVVAEDDPVGRVGSPCGGHGSILPDRMASQPAWPPSPRPQSMATMSSVIPISRWGGTEHQPSMSS